MLFLAQRGARGSGECGARVERQWCVLGSFCSGGVGLLLSEVRYKFMFSRYRDDCYFFNACFLTFNLTFAATPAVLPADQPVMATLVMVVLVLFNLTLQMRLWPWKVTTFALLFLFRFRVREHPLRAASFIGHGVV